jgi:membrane protease YdiL (CAAX protease family)
VTDGQNGASPPDPRPLPERPVPGPPVLPVTPPPAGTPPPGSLRPSGAEHWRWYYALIAFFGGLIVSQVAVLIIGGIWATTKGIAFDQLEKDSMFIVVASAVNELLFIATAYFVARLAGRVTWRDFGLVARRFWPTVGRIATVLVGYLALLAAYNALVKLAPDDAPDKLGASGGTLNMLLFGLLVAVLAPIAEEIFFRGMLFRALRNGAGLWPAAIISGLLFGSLHIDATTTERLLQVVPLVVLGIAFAMLYNWTGTLYSTIALHATNNAIAVAAYAGKQHSDFGLVLAGVLWLAMMLLCTLGPRLTDRRRDPSITYSLPQ